MSHAERSAAGQERLLTYPTLPDDVAVERVKPVDRQLRRVVKKLRQLQTQPLTAEEEAQEGQELLTPALSKWMRGMVQAVQPDGAPTPADVNRVDVVIVFYPLHRQTPLREARRLRLVKKERPRLVYPFPLLPRN